MAAATVNITVANTERWELTINLSRGGEAWDVSDYLARMQMRSPIVNEVAAATFTTEAGTLLTDGSSVILNVPRGITLGIAAGSYAYDMILTRGNDVVRAIEGTVTVKQGVTR